MLKVNFKQDFGKKLIKMIKGREKETLTLKTVLSRVSQYDIYKYYLGHDFDFRKKYISPFREDKTPSLGFKYVSNGDIIYRDFGDDRYRGNIIKFMYQLYGLNYNEALKKIDEDLDLGILKPATGDKKFKITLTKLPEFKEKDNVIQITTRSFTEEDIKYWWQYHISLKELIENDVYSIEKLWLNKVPFIFKSNLRFAYLYDDKFKIYQPYNKECKWITNTRNSYVSGIDLIKYKCHTGIQDNKLIITKSKKDEIILKKFFKDVCSVQSEGTGSLTGETIEYLKKHYGAKNIYIFFDSDQPGVKASKYYTDHGLNYVNIPRIYLYEGIKDCGDLVKEKGLDTLENYLRIKKLIN